MNLISLEKNYLFVQENHSNYLIGLPNDEKTLFYKLCVESI